MTVRIVTDSTADLLVDEVERYGIIVAPLNVLIGSENFRDGIDIQAEEFYRRLPSLRELPKTSQPSAGAFLEIYQQQLAAGASAILSIHISGKLSGTLNAARTARDNLPDPTRVTLIDTGTVSAGSAYGVLAAARVASEGGTSEQAQAAAESALGRAHLVAMLDTLEYLQRGGRVGRTRAWLGGLLNVKPIITFRDGEVAPFERVRTRARAIDRIIELTVAYQHIESVSLIHSCRPDEVERVLKRLSDALPGVPIRTGWFGPVVGVYAGPNTLGTVVLEREAASS